SAEWLSSQLLLRRTLLDASHDEREPFDALDADALSGFRPLAAARLPQLAVHPDLAERVATRHHLRLFADHRLGPGLRLPAPGQPQAPGHLSRLDDEAAEGREQAPR